MGDCLLPGHLRRNGLRQARGRAAPRLCIDVGAHPLHEHDLDPANDHHWPGHRRARKVPHRRLDSPSHLIAAALVRCWRRHLLSRLEGEIARHRHMLHCTRRRQQDAHRASECIDMGPARFSIRGSLPCRLPQWRRSLQASTDGQRASHRQLQHTAASQEARRRHFGVGHGVCHRVRPLLPPAHCHYQIDIGTALLAPHRQVGDVRHHQQPYRFLPPCAPWPSKRECARQPMVRAYESQGGYRQGAT
mmetsp:Transcript_34263/g.68229  ORF Transcript_34263/g.68229 Transcript_34263/m.68229 type:complete len:247 (-) Transcript_34263:381-1121(-)